MSPRPILKSQPHLSPFPFIDDNFTNAEFPTPTCSNNALPFADSRIPPFDSPHVHFPPTPSLTRIEMTHSPFSYDRKPISVSPNACALPERGERDVINIDGSQDALNSASPACYGGYFPPHVKESRAEPETNFENSCSFIPSSVSAQEGAETCASRPSRPHFSRHQTPYHPPSQATQHVTDLSFRDSNSRPPALIFDASSESESDSCISPPMDMHLSSAGISHISTHFSTGEMSVCPNDQGRFSFISRNDKGYALHNILMDPDKRIGKKTRTRTHHRDSPEWCSESTNNSHSAATAAAEGISKYRARRNRGNTSRDCAGVNPFCETGLDGCLGGF